MGVRNCAEIGENLQKIVTRLMANDELVKLLYYTDKDPLSQPYLSNEEKREKIFEKLIKIIPDAPQRDDACSVVIIRVASGSKLGSNTEFSTIKIGVTVFVPLSQWIFKNTNLRPFAILGEIQKSLDDKKINGLGKMQGGNFVLTQLTKEMGIYEQEYWITSYE